MLRQNLWRELEELADEFEQGVVGEVVEGELALGEVSRIGFAEYGVAVAWEYLSGFEGRPEVLCYSFIAEVAGDCFLAFQDPLEGLLVCSTRD